MTDNTQFDAIVVGSGITGGWAAKELTEAGLKVLMIERGRKIEHQGVEQIERFGNAKPGPAGPCIAFKAVE